MFLEWAFIVTVATASGQTVQVVHRHDTDVECGIAMQEFKSKKFDYHVLEANRVITVSGCGEVDKPPFAARTLYP